MKNMATKYPEAVVLEDKFKRLEKVEPRIDASLEKVESLLKFPSQNALSSKETEFNKIISKITQ